MSGSGMLVTDQDWIVLIWDPDYADTSPYSITASDLDSAIAQAKADWRDWLYDPGDPDADWGEPEVHKVYQGAYSGRRVL